MGPPIPPPECRMVFALFFSCCKWHRYGDTGAHPGTGQQPIPLSAEEKPTLISFYNVLV